MHWTPAPLSAEIGDLNEDVRRLFRDIDRSGGRRPLAGQCMPALDVYETDEVVELIVDLPAVPPERLRILLKGGVVVVAGEKEPPAHEEHAAGAFHLVERVYGRFARAVRVSAAFDGARATARFVNGELRISLPKILERRGEPRLVKVG